MQLVFRPSICKLLSVLRRSGGTLVSRLSKTCNVTSLVNEANNPGEKKVIKLTLKSRFSVNCVKFANASPGSCESKLKRRVSDLIFVKVEKHPVGIEEILLKPKSMSIRRVSDVKIPGDDIDVIWLKFSRMSCNCEEFAKR